MKITSLNLLNRCSNFSLKNNHIHLISQFADWCIHFFMTHLQNANRDLQQKLYKLFETALMYASGKGHTEIAKILLEQKGIDLNDKDI